MKKLLLPLFLMLFCITAAFAQNKTIDVTKKTRHFHGNGLVKVDATNKNAVLYADVKDGHLVNWVVKDAQGKVLPHTTSQETAAPHHAPAGHGATEKTKGATIKCKVCIDMYVDGKYIGNQCWYVDCGNIPRQ